MKHNNTDLNQPLSAKLKLLCLFNTLVFAAMATFCFYFAEDFTLGIFKRISEESYYVEATKFGGFVIFGGVAIIILMSLFILRLFNKLTQKTNLILGKSFTYLAILALVSSFIMWPVINHHLEKNNYSYCFHYTGSNMFSPPVYVKNPKYCFKGSRSVTSELFAWFDEQEAAGVELTPLEVKQKIDALKTEKGTDW